MQLAIFGTGYVGLVSGACFANLGHTVVCYDIDENKITSLQAGTIPIFEPGLQDIVTKTVSERRLSFSNSLEDAMSSDVIVIAVGTPPLEDGSVNMEYVYTVAETIGASVSAGSQFVVLTKSTVPVGTAKIVSSRIAAALTKRNIAAKWTVVSNPEFLREGSAVHDFLEPDRIVVGYADAWVKPIMEKLYEPFLQEKVPIYWMDPASAEMAKYGANAMLASRISFMNEMARLCEATGADIEQVRTVMASDKRIGSAFLQPGVGYGGSCFSKDVRAVVAKGEEYGISLKLLHAVELVNEEQKLYFVKKILDAFQGNVQKKKFAVWGLSYKANTNDMRSAPSITVLQELLRAGAVIHAYDPQAVEEAKKVFGNTVDFTDTRDACLQDADALIILTEWDEFRDPDWDQLRATLRNPYIFDGKNMFVPESVTAAGLTYWSIGRQQQPPTLPKE